LNAEIERLIFPVLEAIGPQEQRFVTSEPDDERADAAPAFVRRRLEGLELRLIEIFDEEELLSELQSIGQRVATKHATELRRVAGIAIRDADPGVGAQLNNFRAVNVSRIKSLAGQELVEITQLLETNEAIRVETLSKQIRQRFDVTKSKANLLARDQTLKLKGQIDRLRQTNLGIERYIWTTSGDERVRPEHAELEGTVQRWDVPPSPGHPGDDFQCRCTAFPVLPELT